MEKLEGTWGRYTWAVEYGENLIHPDNLLRFKEFSPSWSLFECVHADVDYITLKLKDEVFKVKPDLYTQVSPPKYVYGDKVVLTKKPEVSGIIEYISWHVKENKPIYFISVNGKLKSTRYWEEDLEQG